MPTDNARLVTTPANIALCRVEDIAEGRARNFVLQMRAGRFHGFVVRQQGGVRGYVDRCPHASLPLARTLDDYLTPDSRFIACGWHGALFAVEDGLCVGGPCVGQKLLGWPVLIDGEWIRTGAAPTNMGLG